MDYCNLQPNNFGSLFSFDLNISIYPSELSFPISSFLSWTILDPFHPLHFSCSLLPEFPCPAPPALFSLLRRFSSSFPDTPQAEASRMADRSKVDDLTGRSPTPRATR